MVVAILQSISLTVFLHLCRWHSSNSSDTTVTISIVTICALMQSFDLIIFIVLRTARPSFWPLCLAFSSRPPSSSTILLCAVRTAFCYLEALLVLSRKTFSSRCTVSILPCGLTVYSCSQGARKTMRLWVIGRGVLMRIDVYWRRLSNWQALVSVNRDAREEMLLLISGW